MSGNESQLVQNTFGFLCVFVWFFDVPNPIQFRNENGSFFLLALALWLQYPSRYSLLVPVL